MACSFAGFRCVSDDSAAHLSKDVEFHQTNLCKRFRYGSKSRWLYLRRWPARGDMCFAPALRLPFLFPHWANTCRFGLIVGLWSISYFVTLIPISINGYGVQELSLTFLFSRVGGISLAASLTLAVLIRVFYMVASLPGAIYMPAILSAMDTEREEPESKV